MQGHWSISYWKYPVGTSNNKTNLTGFSIDSLGQFDGGTTGYDFFGKTSGSNVIFLGGGTTVGFDPNNFFDKWNFVTLTYNSTTDLMTLRYFIPNESVKIATKTEVITSATHYLKDGHDLILGGWIYSAAENTNAGYYKELNVWQVEKTEAEIQQIYDTGLRISKEDHTFNVIGGTLE